MREGGERVGRCEEVGCAEAVVGVDLNFRVGRHNGLFVLWWGGDGWRMWGRLGLSKVGWGGF